MRAPRATCRSSPRSVISFPRATIRRASSASSRRRFSSFRPRRAPRSTSGARVRRWVVVSATRRALGLPHKSSGITRAGQCQFPGAGRASCGARRPRPRGGAGARGGGGRPPARAPGAASGLTGVGASVRGHVPFWVLGNAMTSRMESTPARMATIRSSPNAMPPIGGAPYSSASRRKPNLARAVGLVDPEDLEDPLLERARVDADRAPADLLAVQHEVVGLRARGAGVGQPGLGVRVLRRRERMVHRVPAPLLLVPLDQRESRRPTGARAPPRGSGPRRCASSTRSRPSTVAARGIRSATSSTRSPAFAPVRARSGSRSASRWRAAGLWMRALAHAHPDQPLRAGALGALHEVVQVLAREGGRPAP